MTRILVTGGRDYFNENRIYQILDAAVQRLGLTEIIHGDAEGADRIAKTWAVERGVGHRAFPAKWSDLSQPDARIKTRRDGTRYDAMAGIRRNREMLEQGRPNKVIAFPGGKGTRDMVRQARAAEIETILVDWTD